MRVLIDAFWWFDGPPSGKNVLRSTVFAWATIYPQDVITLLLPRRDRNRNELLNIAAGYPNISFSFTYAPQQALAAATAGAFSRRYDAVLTQNFSPIFGPSKRCVFIHDLMFAEHPEWFTRKERIYLRLIVATMRRAQAVFTSSTSEAERIRRHSPISPTKIKSAGLALSVDFANAYPKALELSLPSKFLLSVGRINVRKNLELLVQSLMEAELISAHQPLVIVGTRDGAQGRKEALDAATAAGAVIWTGSINDSELKWAYQNCEAFIFPSLDEGFGLPVLEALESGAVVVLSDIPAFREFGNIGYFFDPHDGEDIIQKVDLALAAKGMPTDELNSKSWLSVVGKLRRGMIDK